MTNPGFNTNEPVTSPNDYKTRRQLIRAGVIGATALATGYAYRNFNGSGHRPAAELADLPVATTLPTTQAVSGAFKVNEPLTPLNSILNYNNFYEFSTDKDGVASAAAGFDTHDWKISVDGLCNRPTTFSLDDLRRLAPLEERTYRMRCVEAWSMVIPWNGYSLSALLNRVEPQSGAKYVAFTTLLDPQRMPGQKSSILEWPYVEGLRMDEAMHPLTLLAGGIYGKALPPQDGAPFRLVVPWKYGFKGIKSIVKISLVADMPPTSWNRYGSNEYGFYANVNPTVDHPRWSQATEQRIGASRIPTLMFNGYTDQVGMLYSGMDLAKNF